MIDTTTIQKDRENRFKNIYSTDNRIHVSFVKKNYYKSFLQDFKTFVNKPGIYILTGEDDKSAKIYIGEAHNIQNRLGQNHQHFNEKWNNEIILLISHNSEKNFNKDELIFLEKMLIKKSKRKESDGEIEVLNKTTNSEFKISDVNKYQLNQEIDRFYLFLELLNIDLFKEKEKIDVTFAEDDEIFKTREFFEVNISSKRGSDGYGIYYPGTNQLKVLKDSKAANYTQPATLKNKNRNKRLNKLRENPSISLNHEINMYIFKRDILFSSPSGAGALFKGGTNDGNSSWINIKTRKSIKYSLSENKEDKLVFSNNQNLETNNQSIISLDQTKLNNNMNNITKNQTFYEVEMSTKSGSRGFAIFYPKTKKLKVLKGSKAKNFIYNSVKKNEKEIQVIAKLRNIDGISLDNKKEWYIFQKDIIYSYPSRPAKLFYGQECNGWTAWKDKVTNKTLKELLDIWKNK